MPRPPASAFRSPPCPPAELDLLMRSVWQSVSTRLWPRLATARPAATRNPAARQHVRAAALATAEAVEGRLLFAADPVINEFLAINNNGLVDFEGVRSDWIELYNPNAETVSLN